MKTALLYEAAFKCFREAAAIIDHEGKLTDANKACLKLMPVMKKAGPSFNFFDFFSISDKQKNSLLKGSEITTEYCYLPDFSTRKKTISPVKDNKNIKISVMPVKIDGSTSSFFIAVFNEIKTKNYSPEEQEPVTSGFWNIFNKSHIVMFLLDPDNGNIVDANEAASSFYGWSIEELKQKTISGINTLSRDEISGEIQNTKNHKHRYFRSKHILANKSIREVEVFSGPVEIESKIFLFSTVIDITERINTELALHKSEEHFRMLLENIPAALFIQTKGKFSYLNDIAVELFGAKNTEELLGTKVVDRIHPSFHDLQSLSTKKIKNNKLSEEIYLKLDGTSIIVEAASVPITFQDKEGLLTFVSDITKRKENEENLKKSTEKLQGIFHDASIGIGVYEKNILKDVNQQLCLLTGYTREELIGKNIKKFFCDEKEYDSVRKKIFNNTQNGITQTAEAHWQKKDRSIINVILTNAHIAPDLNSAATFTVLDMTERKQNEEQIYLLSKISDSAPVSIFIHDNEGNILYANENTYKTYGYNKNEFRNITLHDLLGPAGINSAPLRRQKLIKEGEASFEIDMRKKNGTVIPMRTNARRIKWRETDVILSVNVDLSEQKLTEEYISRSQKLDSLGVLAGGIAHDFNNLLSILFGYLNLALATSTENEVIDYLQKAVTGFNRTKNLTKQLLTFSKGGTPVRKTSSISVFLKNTANFALSGSNIKTHFNIQKDLWLCEYDESQMGQLIDNLVINAKQAMPSGGTLSIEAVNTKVKLDEHPSLKSGKYIKISITDSGTGIPEHIIPRIFDPFFTTKQKGNGLGLATVYSIIKKHDGDIFVESVPGRGTTFSIFIPAAASKYDVHQKSEVQEHKGNGNILIMDDEPGIRHITSRMLKKMGYNTSLASNGNEALDIYNKALKENNPFDFVFLDLTVAGGSGGEETLQKLKKADQKLISFAMSGYSDDPVMSNPEKYGFNDKLSKPFMKQDLAVLLNRYCSMEPQNKK
ncbi:MAG: PAS domain S-box protein [Spirochaetes bacterium]|nr:PAS domain S-box protein [Spirochaetota bacterium]